MIDCTELHPPQEADGRAGEGQESMRTGDSA